MVPCCPASPAAAASAYWRLVLAPPISRPQHGPSLTWVAHLQWDMMQLKKDPRFKEKFPEHAANEEAEAEAERSLTVRLRSSEQEQQ